MGRFLEARAKGQTGEAIRHLIGMQAKTARVVRDDAEEDIPIEQVVAGDVIVVRPGEKSPGRRAHPRRPFGRSTNP